MSGRATLSYFEFVFSVVPGNFQFFLNLLLNLVPLFYYYFRTQLFIYLFIYLASRNMYGAKHE